jgi:hypothetical protein
VTGGHAGGVHRVCAGIQHLLIRWYRECQGFADVGPDRVAANMATGCERSKARASFLCALSYCGLVVLSGGISVAGPMVTVAAKR